MSDKMSVDEGDHAPSVTDQVGAQMSESNTNTATPTSPQKEWVKFEDEGSNKDPQVTPPKNKSTQEPTADVVAKLDTQPNTKPAAVLETETTHVNLQEKNNNGNRNGHSSAKNGVDKTNHPQGRFPVTTVQPTSINSQSQTLSSPAVIDIPPSVAVNRNNNIQSNGTNHSSSASTEINQMRTIELSTGRVREGFANGDVIVTLLPLNRNLQWITPPVFRPELVPEELMAQGLTLTVEEYVQAMETLVNDYRFTMYNMCYKRVLVGWILFAFGILLGLLFSGLTGITLFALGVTWLFLNMATVFLCMWVKIRLARGLEKCLARVNKQLLRHKILLVLDDRGRISCHKVNLCFVYFDAAQCVNYLNGFIEHNEQNGTAIEPGWEARLDLNTSDIVIQGANQTRVSRKQTRAENLYLRYGQRWGKDFLRRRLDWILAENCQRNGTARHLQAAICPCQYVEEILNCKDLRPSFPSRIRSCILNCC